MFRVINVKPKAQLSRHGNVVETVNLVYQLRLTLGISSCFEIDEIDKPFNCILGSFLYTAVNIHLEFNLIDQATSSSTRSRLVTQFDFYLYFMLCYVLSYAKNKFSFLVLG